LTQTTFFNWDAAVYDLSKSTLHYSPEYFRWVESGVLEINLEPNPNPAGNVRRALRLALSGDARLGPRLTEYVLRFLTDSDWEVARLESYSHYFVIGVVRRLITFLSNHMNERPGEPFDITSTQLQLAIPALESPQQIPTSF